MEVLIESLNSVIRDYILVIALGAIGIFFTFYTKGVQLRELPQGLKKTFSLKGKGDDDGISSFQALAVSIAAQIGTGNVVGIATAIMAGGPGAIFWLWIMAFFGSATIFAEAVLAQTYREKDSDGQWIGGPAYYIKNGVKNKSLANFLSKFFAIMIVIALGFFGLMTQSNSIASSFNSAFPQIPLIAIGIVIAIVATLVFAGGIQRIANFAELVVPIMATLYIVFTIIALVKFRSNIIPAFKLIFSSAFTPTAAAGGAVGYGFKKALSYGFSRGLFSNEAGMGSTPHAHATAEVKHPVEEGLVAFVGVLITTIICTASALILLVTNPFKEGLNGALLTQEAFEIAFGRGGKLMLTIALAFFAFTTIIGWYYYGETNINYLFGKKGIWPYRIFVIIALVLGATLKIEMVWSLSDLFNSFMVLPNIIALFLLRNEVKKSLIDYENLVGIDSNLE